MQFPDDDNGDVLRRLQSKGDDLSSPRDIDFTVTFPDQPAAESFAQHFRGLGFRASVEHTKVKANRPWDVLIVNHMIPTYEGIGAFEEALSQTAEPLGGLNDGWGCITQNQKTV